MEYMMKQVVHGGGPAWTFDNYLTMTPVNRIEFEKLGND